MSDRPALVEEKGEEMVMSGRCVCSDVSGRHYDIWMVKPLMYTGSCAQGIFVMRRQGYISSWKRDGSESLKLLSASQAARTK
jgi:hypothetical protein